MSPKMEAALRAARKAGADGLGWNGVGWSIDGSFQHHGPVVVSRLVHDRGFLAEAGVPGRKLKNSRRTITEAGRAYLAEQDAKERAI